MPEAHICEAQKYKKNNVLKHFQSRTETFCGKFWKIMEESGKLFILLPDAIMCDHGRILRKIQRKD
jgi:hypothetical protein